MQPSEYERQYDEDAPEPVDNAITMGTTPDPNFESSPDVAIDGSINTDDSNEKEQNSQQDGSGGLLARLREWLAN